MLTSQRICTHICFCHNTQANEAKAKESASKRTGTVQTTVFNLTRQTIDRRRSPAGNMGLKEMAGAVRKQTVVLSIYICAWRQVSAFNPPLL